MGGRLARSREPAQRAPAALLPATQPNLDPAIRLLRWTMVCPTTHRSESYNRAFHMREPDVFLPDLCVDTLCFERASSLASQYQGGVVDA